MNKLSLYSLLILLIYCVALAPSFIPHSHENSKHTNSKFNKHSQCDSHKHEKTKWKRLNVGLQRCRPVQIHLPGGGGGQNPSGVLAKHA